MKKQRYFLLVVQIDAAPVAFLVTDINFLRNLFPISLCSDLC